MQNVSPKISCRYRKIVKDIMLHSSYDVNDPVCS